MKPLREKYKEADALYTYAFTQFWSALDPKLSARERRGHLAETGSGYDSALKALTEAHNLAEAIIHGKQPPKSTAPTRT